ncbi:chemotaxis protein CheB [Paractinoplanes abujensis]|uniref:histidine kinase n=1 Tax=Paractinoplanes abujensis TaxID=882441 RepID=A0A7W7FYR7_9ACTN|nr:chemotaxis protein CheB [Actinoplanes abujensis]MBB4689934.1 signal transduction histidine kinase/chemotaxis response regulator CheB [Actinoplanes abujensis]
MAGRYQGVVVGSSLGGIEALQLVLGRVQRLIGVPIVVAHHIGPSVSRLEKVLGRTSRLPVRWATDGGPVEPNVVHLCPPRSLVRWEPDGTFTVRRHEGGSSLGLVDELFSSAADALGHHLLAVVLTGAGSDGTAGARVVRDAGGTVVAEDEETATASGMPGSVVRAGLADLVLPLAEIPGMLDRVIGLGRSLPLPELLAAEAVFAAGGEMGALMAATDWARSALGPVERWSPVLRSTLAMALGSDLAMCVLWGRDLVLLYNDAYRDIIGGKHPTVLGRSAASAFPETAHLNDPLFQRIRDTGRGLLQRDQPTPYMRDGELEEAFFTFSYSPLYEGSEIVGLLATVVDTTHQVQAGRRLRVLHRLATGGLDDGDAESAVCDRVAAVLADDPEDVPFALLYLVDRVGAELHLAAAVGLEPGSVAAPRRMSVSEATAWPISAVVRRAEPRVVDGLPDGFRGLVCGPYPEQPTKALVLPAGRHSDGSTAAVVVLGASARIPLAVAYRSFFELVAEQVGASLTAARRRQEARERIAALTALDRDKTEFFAGVSHEFRTPLTLTLGPLEQLLDTPVADLRPDEVHTAVRVAHRNALRLLRLVNTLLEFAQLEQGRRRLRLEDVDLAALTTDLAGVFRSAVEKAGLELVVDCPPLPRTVTVDPEMWERIVLNLISNALKHTFTGSITVALRPLPNHVELEVADTGIGIADDQLPLLFTRFHRVRGARARSHEGSGLGLALVQQLARLHRGTVRVRSTLGVGSRFTVWLPLNQRRPADPTTDDHPEARNEHRRAFAEEAELWLNGHDLPAGIQDAAPPAPGLPGRKPTVLLVDDNPDMRDYVRRLLSDRYEVTAVADGRQALDALVERGFDLVLSDVMMPELDGLALLARIRTDPRHRATPVILLTALADPGSTVAGLAAGAHDYIVKPFTARELIARVEAQLALARLRADPGRGTSS